jgi:hypothetical protein
MTIITIFSPGAKTKETQQETLIRMRFLQEENLEGPNAHITKHRAGGGIKGVKGG